MKTAEKNCKDYQWLSSSYYNLQVLPISLTVSLGALGFGGAGFCPIIMGTRFNKTHVSARNGLIMLPLKFIPF